MSAAGRVAVVLPSPHQRDAVLFIAAARRSPQRVTIFTPTGGDEGQWPGDVDRVALPAREVTGHTSQWLRGLRGQLVALEPTVVHVCFEAWGLVPQHLATRRWALVVHAAESRIRDAPLRYRLRRTGLKRVLRTCSGYIAWGHTPMAAALAAGLPEHTPHTVIPASPPDPLAFPRAPLVPGPKLRVLFVGRMIQSKGPADLLRAVAASRNSSRMTVTLVGSGPMRAELGQLAARIGVAASFPGQLDRMGIHAAMTACDVLVVPSRDTATWREQWGRVVVEAMLTGRPVLASDSGELPHLVADPAAIFGQGDVRAIAERLDELAEDPGLLARRAHTAYQRGIEFTPDALAGSVLEFWREVTTGNGH